MSAPPSKNPAVPSASPNAPLALLEVVHPSGKRTRAGVSALPFRLGRQSDNHLQLRDSRISRNHAEIHFEGDGYRLQDLHSSHGTWVNGHRIDTSPLCHGDLIDFGFDDSYRLQFLLEGHEISRILGRLEPGAEPKETGGLGKLTVLLEVARTLQSSLGVDEVLTSVVDAAISVTGSERGFLLLTENDSLVVRVARTQGHRNLSSEELKVPTSKILRELKQRRELLTMTFDPSMENFDPQQTVAALELRSVICIPLIRMRAGGPPRDTIADAAMHETVGVLYLDTSELGSRLTVADRELLQTLALEASNVIENTRLLADEQRNRKMQEELEIARSIQQSLLPRSLPQSGWFRASGISIPSQNVAGDYFDVRQVRPDRVVNIIVDVSGKGVSSALLASLLQGIFVAGSAEGSDLPALMSRTNEFLVERTEGEKYATMFYCILDRDGTLCWTNAGHCAGILVRPGQRYELLKPTSMPLGMLPGAEFEVRYTKLQPGDKLCLYSDGLSEAHLPPSDTGSYLFYGDERIVETLRRCEGASSREIQEALLRDVQDFLSGGEQTDDVTLLIIEYAN